MTKIKIHLADDHQVLIDGLTNLLQTVSNFEIVGSSLNGVTVYDDVIQDQADILVLDISMPQKDGIEVLKEFNQKGLPCKVIILSSYDDLKIIKEVMKLGAKGYLTKKCAGENMIEAIEAVYEGQEYFSDAVREKIFSMFSQNNPKLNKNVYIENPILSPREIEIVTLICLEYSGKEISEKLFISVNTVETHRKNIMKKLNIKNTIGLVKYALKNNLINE
ncbi:response regulator [Flavobacterium johnsoniae]|jgi:DNA-binding NarL/FixJ family response regulator|uniref:Two component transcriptional regulator, LuxR family n=2 Tax=Flavobacterium johnsoniae TaxID=986 RepID=A0A1M6XJY2_FLAJO|nr:response regulator transcription factor [Flavobacterium johnsoniae]ABQ07663.1 two component transcriptional regulator, LuxR family [Flavobacterium johnsoniae UW101]OXG01748.1 DNA-binding response regulator [Flavobacterium johnsoniae UW101]WQG80498.1 response regulator transcription factor [Flavobacterium johnsoniae UW101]SHG30105.1 two component transcriptional regulator, LuxR family [Flavobacterium johnsoniae]SHL06208.1 two component transcriptional regulator, LuxR family [Flavobacterium j